MQTTDGGATAQAQEKAQQVAGQAAEQAQQAAGQAKDQVRSQVDQRSTQAGEQVSSQAQDVRTIAQQLREQGKDKPAELAEKAADRAEQVGSYLKQSDADRILHDVEDFARQRPWAVIAGGVALGFAASRFLKASGSDRYQQRYSPATSQGYRTPTAQPTGYGIPSGRPSTGLTATPPGGNELSGGVPAAPTPGEAQRPQTPATAPVTGGL